MRQAPLVAWDYTRFRTRLECRHPRPTVTTSHRKACMHRSKQVTCRQRHSITLKILTMPHCIGNVANIFSRPASTVPFAAVFSRSDIVLLSRMRSCSALYPHSPCSPSTRQSFAWSFNSYMASSAFVAATLPASVWSKGRPLPNL